MSKKVIKENSKDKNKYKIIAILYLLCAICWFISGIIDIKKDSSALFGYVDIGLFAVWTTFAIIYLKKMKESK